MRIRPANHTPVVCVVRAGGIAALGESLGRCWGRRGSKREAMAVARGCEGPGAAVLNRKWLWGLTGGSRKSLARRAPRGPMRRIMDDSMTVLDWGGKASPAASGTAAHRRGKGRSAGRSVYRAKGGEEGRSSCRLGPSWSSGVEARRGSAGPRRGHEVLNGGSGAGGAAARCRWRASCAFFQFGVRRAAMSLAGWVETRSRMSLR